MGPRSPELRVISNRLPVRLDASGPGAPTARPSSGGLVTALRPLLRRSGGSWTGWPGVCEQDRNRLRSWLRDVEPHFQLRPVPLTEAERDDYYLGFANQVLWPLLHGFPALMNVQPEFWKAYQSVNRRFARVVAEGNSGDFIWVHDYHHLLLGEALREEGSRDPIGFFLHTPFPDPADLARLPMHREVLRALLRFDAVGFQTQRDRRNFLAALDEVPLPAGDGNEPLAAPRRPRTMAVPISIDFDEWSHGAARDSVRIRAEEIRRDFGPLEHLLLGVDRLDYSKGIPAKLRALREILRRDPSLRGSLVLIQLVVPSREGISHYQAEKKRIDDLSRETNEEFAKDGWRPVHIIHGEWDRKELMAHYRAADIAVITPWRDGMNLVSKEYCACRIREPGSLVLSRHAGSAEQLGAGAHLVEPREHETIARAIQEVLRTPLAERRERMALMRQSVQEQDVHWWAEAFMEAMEEATETAARDRRSFVASA